MNEENKEKVSKLSLAPITTLMCILSGTFLIMLVMLFSLYCKAIDGVVEGKIPIDKLDLKMSDGFIGATATLIGIMVTFVIGYQILNALQIKKDIEEFKKEILSSLSALKESSKIDLNNSIEELEIKINKYINDNIIKELTNNKNELTKLKIYAEPKIKALDLDKSITNLNMAAIQFQNNNKSMPANRFIISYIELITICDNIMLYEDNNLVNNAVNILSNHNKLLNSALVHLYKWRDRNKSNPERIKRLSELIDNNIEIYHISEFIITLQQMKQVLNGEIQQVVLDIFDESTDSF